MLKLETHEQQVAGLAEQVTSSVVLPLRLPSRSDGRSTLGLTQKADHTIGCEVYADRQRHRREDDRTEADQEVLHR